MVMAWPPEMATLNVSAELVRNASLIMLLNFSFVRGFSVVAITSLMLNTCLKNPLKLLATSVFR